MIRIKDIHELVVLSLGQHQPRVPQGLQHHTRNSQKSPIHIAKEAYSHGKRGLFTWQKRPIHMAKEAYSY